MRARLKRGQSSVRLSYSPPSPHTLQPYTLRLVGHTHRGGGVSKLKPQGKPFAGQTSPEVHHVAPFSWCRAC